MEKRRNRSEAYQVLYHEIACSNDMISSFTNDDSIHGRLTGGFSYDETILELEDQLREEFWKIVDTCLTERQREVVHLCADGYTQMEIAKMLKVNQSSVAKQILGNKSYDINELGRKTIRTYGGITKRIHKVLEDNQEVKDILAKIAECRAEKW